MNKFILIVLLSLPVLAIAQTSQTGQDSQTEKTTSEDIALMMAERSQMALSTHDYRVTAGDVYSLAYAMAGQIVTYTIPVDTSYRIRVSNLGIINAAGKTYNQLKTQVEGIVTNNYPLSGVQFVLTQPASFKVAIRGEVKSSAEVSAWALTRLGEVIQDHVTDFSSTRDIEILSSDGQAKSYDLYRALRTGDLAQNPYLRPGDTITVKRISRLVTVSGAVERPGRYQLKEGENLQDLIEAYGSGFTPTADKTRMELVRLVNSAATSGDKIFLRESDIAANYALEHYDVITIPEIVKLQPVMFIEGAVSITASSVPAGSTRIIVSFNTGENYASMVRRNSGYFTSISDTLNAYIIRGGAQIPLNLNPMLYDSSYRDDILIEENDTLIIPFRQYFVTVAGAVNRPGNYPYIPDRNWEYYIALAGGFTKEKNSRNSVDIVDLMGKKMRKADVITPETVITARTNAFLYYFNQYAPIITTTLSILTTFIAITGRNPFSR